jgi:hypothetical protein
MVAVVALALAVVGVAHSASLVQQNLLFTRAQTEVSFWGRGDYQPDETTINRTVNQLEDLLKTSPKHPDYLSLQANAVVWLAYWSEKDASASSGRSVQQASNSQYAALQSRPAHRYSWVKLAEYLSRSEASEHKLALVALTQTRLSALTVKASP